MKKETILKIVLSVIALGVLITAGFLIGNHFTSKSEGTIIVEYVSLDGEILKSKEIDFYDGDTLVQLIQENFDNVVLDGTMIMSIEDYTTPSDWSTFLSINVDDIPSMVGITEISFSDGTKISIIVTEFIYE